MRQRPSRPLERLRRARRSTPAPRRRARPAGGTSGCAGQRPLGAVEGRSCVSRQRLFQPAEIAQHLRVHQAPCGNRPAQARRRARTCRSGTSPCRPMSRRRIAIEIVALEHDWGRARSPARIRPSASASGPIRCSAMAMRGVAPRQASGRAPAPSCSLPGSRRRWRPRWWLVSRNQAQSARPA